MILDRIKFLSYARQQNNFHSQDRFLRDVGGVIHVGANEGQERALYIDHALKVIWVEPIPEVFHRLQENIRDYNHQLAFQALITDKDDEEYTFNVASNDGASSSILDFKYHPDIWPHVTYTSKISLKSTTLNTLISTNHINPEDYQALIIDTQGSELLVLKGAISILRYIKYVKIEVADFEAYKNCCQLTDINAFMAEHGFTEISRIKLADHPQCGSYFDIVYARPLINTQRESSV